MSSFIADMEAKLYEIEKEGEMIRRIISAYKDYLDVVRERGEKMRHKAIVDVPAPPFIPHPACDKLFEERIREPVTVEEQLEFREHPLESKRVRLITNQWKKENRIANFTAEMVLCRMEDKYGKPEDGKVWKNIRMFSSDEDVAEWDKTH